jgi:polysaccharide export outer membrane protein
MNSDKTKALLPMLIRIPLWLFVGFSAFAQVQVQVQPQATGPNLPAQKIHANDLVGVSVYGEPDLTRTVRVGADGTIRLPLLKDKIKADGLMPEQLEQAIVEALKADELLVDPFVTVTVAEYHNARLPISVAGAVRNPTTFQPVEQITLLEAITRAGGLAPEAGPEILVTGPASPGSDSSLVRRVQVKSLIETADPASNLVLAGGEEIRVPALVVSKVYVVGNVKNPGAFPVDESGTSILKVLALTQGLAPFATKEAFIYRREGGAASKSEIPVELKKIMDRKSPDVPLLANDVFYVPDNHARRATMSALEKVLVLGGVALTALIYVALHY